MPTDDGTDESLAIVLLQDIREMFCIAQTDRMPTLSLLSWLNANSEVPWRRYNKGGPMAAQQLAGLLRPFGIFPTNIRFGEETLTGYYLKDFPDAFERYLD